MCSVENRMNTSRQDPRCGGPAQCGRMHRVTGTIASRALRQLTLRYVCLRQLTFLSEAKNPRTNPISRRSVVQADGCDETKATARATSIGRALPAFPHYNRFEMLQDIFRIP